MTQALELLLGPWTLKILEGIGLAGFAFSGLTVAIQMRMGFVGRFVLSFLPALWGGFLRDLVLKNPKPFLTHAEWPLTLVIAVAALGPFLLNRIPTGHKQKILCALELCDALGLALFSLAAVQIVIQTGHEPTWFWGMFAAFLTVSGGGIVRDFIQGKHTLLHGKGYGEVAVGGALLLALGQAYLPTPATGAFFLTVLIAMVMVRAWFIFKTPPYA